MTRTTQKMVIAFIIDRTTNTYLKINKFGVDVQQKRLLTLRDCLEKCDVI